MIERIDALGAAQCLAWGALYYAFGIVLDPMARALGIDRVVAVGAFSAGIATAALLAPHAARVFARGQALRAMRIATVAGAIGLFSFATVDSVVALYATWIALGACIAFALYEAAYAVVADTVDEPTRGAAWMRVTIGGALASPIAVPVVHALVAGQGWREAVAWTGVAMLVAAALTFALRDAPRAVHAAAESVGPRLRGFATASIFLPALGTATAATVGVLMFVDLLDRGVAPAIATSVPVAIGLAQIPGRLLASRAFRLDLRGLTIASVALQSGGLVALALVEAAPPLLVAATAFGMGAGLNTLLKPMWFARLASAGAVHALNARSAIWQNGARAAAPFAAAWLAHATGGMVGLVCAFAAALVLCGALVVRALAITPPAASSPASCRA